MAAGVSTGRTGLIEGPEVAARRRRRLRDSTISRSFRGPQMASHRHPDHLRRKRYRLGAALNLRSVPIGTTVSRGSALKPGRAVWLREASANVPACAPRPLRNHVQHGGTKAVFEMTYAGRLAMFAIRVSYPGGHSVWLTRRFPTVAWGLKKDALPFPTEADAARTIARLRPSGPVSIEPIAPEIAKPA